MTILPAPAYLKGPDGMPEMHWHKWKNDFDFYLATDWVITETGSGSRAISQSKGGNLVVTNAASDNDVNSLQLRDVASGQVAEHWKWISGKRMWFETRFKVSDATECDLVIGLHITATTPIASAPTDGIYFRKDDGDRLVDLFGVKNSTGSTGTGVLGQSGYLTSDTFTTLAFYYDGKTLANGGAIVGYQDGVAFTSIPLTNVVDDEELAVSFAHQNGEAVAKLLTLDYIFVAQER